MCINHVLLVVMMYLVQWHFIPQEVVTNVKMTAKRILQHQVIIDVILVCTYHCCSSYQSHCHPRWWHAMYPPSYISVRCNLRILLWLKYRTVLWPQVTGSWFVKGKCVYCIIVCVFYQLVLLQQSDTAVLLLRYQQPILHTSHQVCTQWSWCVSV